MDNTFFQFPLRCLRLKKPLDDVTPDETTDAVSKIIHWCLVDVGQKLFDSNGQLWDIARKYTDEHDLDFDAYNSEQRVMFAAAQTLNISLGGGNPKSQQKSHREIQSIAGGSKQVRMRSDFIWGTRDKQDLTWRQFAILSAIYAGIGRKKKARLSFEQIATMSLGYNGQTEMKRQSNHQARKKRLLTRDKTRYTIQRLAARGFFARASLNRPALLVFKPTFKNATWRCSYQCKGRRNTKIRCR